MVRAVHHDTTPSGQAAGPSTGAGGLGGELALRLRGHLDVLYAPQVAAAACDALLRDIARAAPLLAQRPRRATLFDERDAILITYGDQIHTPGEAPLRTLGAFLERHTSDVLSGVHILPCYPWTSDDGFAVVDYGAIDPDLGDWGDIEALAERWDVMLDAVFNHVSASSPWVHRWQAGQPGFRNHLISLDPATDLSRVTRPRALPLLTPVETIDGTQHVWSTFGPDQLDLNYAEPEVLRAVTAHLLDYVAKGANVIRLDAIAFLWKTIGTSCVHLPETHEVIRLWRTILDAVAPGTCLITETNVPHAENIRYFGDGTDEAHLVYQFPLSPLTLHAFVVGDGRHLSTWAEGLSTPSDQTAFFNFLGSHDGIGMRPAEGLLPDEAVSQLVDVVQSHGGGISMRTNPDGSLSPYELNTTFFDALNDPAVSESDQVRVQRFRTAHALLLSLAGVPGVYVQALLGGRNWIEGMEQTGRARSINRRKYDLAELESELAEPGGLRRQVMTAMLGLLAARRREPAFHPNAPQQVIWAHHALVCLLRTRLDGSRQVLCVHNVSGEHVSVTVGSVDGLDLRGRVTDLLGGRTVRVRRGGAVTLEVAPYGCAWLLGRV